MSELTKLREWANWWQNKSCHPAGYYEPRNTEELAEIVRAANAQNQKVKAVGSGHSWSDVPCTNGYMISLKKFNKILEIDVKNQTVTAQSGVQVYQLIDAIKQYDLALSTLGSICEQTLAGALATGTHGTSLFQGGLASTVVELELVDGLGQVIKCSKQLSTETFAASLIGIGVLGIVTQITIQCSQQFYLNERMEHWSIKDVIKNIDVLSKENYFRLWYTTQNHGAIVNTFTQVKSPVQSTSRLRRFKGQISWYLWIYQYYNFSKKQLLPFIRVDQSQYILCYPRWLLKIYKLFIDLTKSPRKTLISEYGIAVDQAATVIGKIIALVQQGEIKGDLRFEVRFGDAEESWLSTAYQRPTCYVQTVFELKSFVSPEAQQEAFCQVETLIKSFNGRPHWAKDHSYTSPDLRRVYPRWGEFLHIRQKLDPLQCFTNAYLSRILGNEEGH